jgi:hypothetical protein
MASLPVDLTHARRLVRAVTADGTLHAKQALADYALSGLTAAQKSELLRAVVDAEVPALMKGVLMAQRSKGPLFESARHHADMVLVAAASVAARLTLASMDCFEQLLKAMSEDAAGYDCRGGPTAEELVWAAYQPGWPLNLQTQLASQLYTRALEPFAAGSAGAVDGPAMRLLTHVVRAGSLHRSVRAVLASLVLYTLKARQEKVGSATSPRDLERAAAPFMPLVRLLWADMSWGDMQLTPADGAGDYLRDAFELHGRVYAGARGGGE